ncbi:MAG TPA: CoA ester lyase [Candidatus Dormibacteraeota bacterium]|nr:CoA ester lyase [Candidatus Dormibacteraeota bacterium]
MLLRSMLYFPANSVRMVVKAATLPVDAVIFDLEDAVSLDDKETARILSRDYVSLIKSHGKQTFVRLNSLGTGLTMEDLKSVVVKGLDGVILAKTESKSDVIQLAKMLGPVEKRSSLKPKSVKIMPLIESARGVENSLDIATVSDRTLAVAFGAGDYYRDLGRDVTMISEEENELLYARSRIVNTARAAGIQAIDTPFLGSIADKVAFLGEVKLAVRLGFKGKQCVHPSQIEPINEFFSPRREDVNRAMRIVAAFDKAQERGLAAISFEGKMVDMMTYRQAKDLIATSQAIEKRLETATQLEQHVSISEIFAKP